MSHTALDHRPRVGAGLRRRRPRRATSCSAPRGWCSTATSGASPLEDARARGPGRGVGGPQRADGRDQLLARRAGPRGAGVGRALQRDRAATCSRRWRPPAGTSSRGARRRRPARDPTRRSRPGAPRPSGRRSTRCSTPSRSRCSRAEGVWITDTAGRTYLDAYNNVPCVGHAHPRVTAAIARQSRRINTHTRYLHPSAIELAERLTATCPPELDTVLLVNSGSEANDLAWRMATAVTGRRGGLCTAFAYHGITEATAALSPEGWFGAPGPDHVETWDPLAGRRRRSTAAIERLGARSAGRGDPRRADHQRRHRRPRAGVRAGARPAHPRGGRAVDRRRGAVRPRPHRRRAVGVRRAPASSRTSSRSASRWATATRSPRSSPAARSSPSSSATPRCSAPSAATRSARPRRSPCST